MIHRSIFFAVFCAVVLPAAAQKPISEITHYTIEVKIPDSYGKFEVRALLNLRDRTPGIHEALTLTLCRNFYGVKPENIRVLNGRNQPLSFEFRDTAGLMIIRDWNKSNNRQVIVQYDLVKDENYEGDPYVNFACEMSDTLNHINAAITRTDTWYPKIEGTLHKRLPPFELIIDVPAHFEVMASGKLTDVIAQDNRKVYNWESYNITDRSLYFFAQKLKKIMISYDDGFEIMTYVPDTAVDENVTYLADVIHKCYRFFEQTFGTAFQEPYKLMAFPYGYAGLCNSMTAPVSLFTTEINNNEIYQPIRLVIHEVSHTWWGNLVSSDAEENYWLYEGFGKYSEVIGIQPALGVDVEELSFYRLKLATQPYLDNVPAILDAGKIEDRQLQAVAAYYMGATYLRMLEYAIGRETFHGAIKDFVAKYRGMCTSTDDFVKFMRKRAGPELHNVISDYLTKPGYARYSFTQLATVDAGKHYIHNYEVENAGDKDMCVEFAVQSDLENYRRKELLPKGDKFTIPVRSTYPLGEGLVTIDPDSIFPVWADGLCGCGGMVYTNQQGEIKFTGITQNTPLARAGIQDNMTLLALNGKELKGKSLHELNALLLRTKGTQLELLVQSDNEPAREVIVVYE